MNRQTRQPRPMTRERLERAGYHYLERFASSRENMRRVLERKCRRSHADGAPPSAEQEGWIADILNRCEALGLLDDAAYAEMKARSLAARGKAARHIRAWLASRGVGEDHITRALDALARDAGGDAAAETARARRFAKRRRMGPYRKQALDDTRKRKEMGAFARAGFSFGLARAIIDAADADALDQLETDAADRCTDMEDI